MIKSLLKFTFIVLFTFTSVVTAADNSPNILLLISDDQRKDMATPMVMPQVHKRIKDQGVEFTKAYITTPLCCPARSGIYTGQYNGRNGVIGNNYKLLGNTIFKDFTNNYQVGIVGKYLNSHDGSYLPEFDYWAIEPYGSVGFWEQDFNINGQMTKMKDVHLTRRLSGFFENFLDQQAQQKKTDQPFFFVAAFFSPHNPSEADTPDIGRFKDFSFKFAPSYNIKKDNQPDFLKKIQMNHNQDSHQAEYRKRMDCSFSMDRQIGKMLDQLENRDLMKDTIVIYLSDNGYQRGEHGLGSKGYAYEESTIVPMFVRYDPLTKALNGKPQQEYQHIVGNIDIPATLYDLANIKPNHKVDGVSFVSALQGEDKPVRKYLLGEGWRVKKIKKRPAFISMRDDRYVLIINQADLSELYDLEEDPYQLNNLFKSPEHQAIKDKLFTRLKEKTIETRGAFDYRIPKGERILKINITNPREDL